MEEQTNLINLNININVDIFARGKSKFPIKISGLITNNGQDRIADNNEFLFVISSTVDSKYVFTQINLEAEKRE